MEIAIACCPKGYDELNMSQTDHAYDRQKSLKKMDIWLFSY